MIQYFDEQLRQKHDKSDPSKLQQKKTTYVLRQGSKWKTGMSNLTLR
jgi:hypothetical protein